MVSVTVGWAGCRWYRQLFGWYNGVAIILLTVRGSGSRVDLWVWNDILAAYAGFWALPALVLFFQPFVASLVEGFAWKSERIHLS